MPSYPFTLSGSAMVASNGTAEIVLGPTKANESWTVTHSQLANTEVNAIEPILIPTVYVYRNFIGSGGFIEGTINGRNGASDTVIELQSSEMLVFDWSRGTPGTLATVTVRGYRYVHG